MRQSVRLMKVLSHWAPETVPSLNVSLYRYVWRTTFSVQIRIFILTALLSPLAMVPLELQRLIINNVTGDRDVELLIILSIIFIVT